MSRACMVFHSGAYSIWEEIDAHAFHVMEDREDRQIWRAKYEADGELSRSMVRQRAFGFLQGIQWNRHDKVDGADLTST